MTNLSEIAPAFIQMAHQIVWCSVATVDTQGRPAYPPSHLGVGWCPSGRLDWDQADAIKTRPSQGQSVPIRELLDTYS